MWNKWKKELNSNWKRRKPENLNIKAIKVLNN